MPWSCWRQTRPGNYMQAADSRRPPTTWRAGTGSAWSGMESTSPSTPPRALMPYITYRWPTLPDPGVLANIYNPNGYDYYTLNGQLRSLRPLTL